MTTRTERRVLAAARRFAALADLYRKHAGGRYIATQTDAAELRLIKICAADAAARKRRKRK